METQIVKQNNSPLKIEFTPEQVKLIKSQIAPNTTDDELNLFLYQCQRTGLDPLTRQIYCMKRYAGGQQRMTIQTSIDGFRVIAERSGDYGGQDEPIFETNAAGTLVVKATVKVYKFRGDVRYCAAVGVAYWDEYYPGDSQGFMWKKMPHTMLSKVAEALALRKAYPQDLSGLYTNDEMNQADKQNDSVNQDTKPTVEISPVKEFPASAEQMIWIESLMQTTSASEEKVIALERRIAEGLTTESAEKAIAWLKDNQINNMKDGKGNYSTTDITNQIKKEML